MPIYVYETIPAAPDEPVERFELRQSIPSGSRGAAPMGGCGASSCCMN